MSECRQMSGCHRDVGTDEGRGYMQLKSTTVEFQSRLLTILCPCAGWRGMGPVRCRLQKRALGCHISSIHGPQSQQSLRLSPVTSPCASRHGSVFHSNGQFHDLVCSSPPNNGQFHALVLPIPSPPCPIRLRFCGRSYLETSISYLDGKETRTCFYCIVSSCLKFSSAVRQELGGGPGSGLLLGFLTFVG
ncbi:hypothetical protein N656DRAFT_256955 [Canariomyces notabilis]|uniref:Uncharacterized protein n=1 Tax=Canariomyces notabilis TaxID=2074819 RepID=A0AAN6YWX0_9PEZI|nr:hypothetical protein N656DRAFT_256955 [Canariomyces arenarius]